MAVLGFLGLGALRSMGEPQRPTGRPAVVRRLVTAILIGAALGSCGYLVIQHQELVRRAGAATPLDFLSGGVAVLVVLELARRTTGWGLVSVAFVAIAYALVGPWLPGLLAHRGYTIRRLIEHLYLTTEGIWGVPLGAKTAAVASALMGSLSGSAVANVVTTGSLTIPIMKRVGFHPQFAAAIEAAASTGGQLMPPIMGAGAFILATWTNIPYVRVATAAIIPALLYYAALFMAIHFRAEQAGLTSTAEKEAAAVLPRLHLLAPLGIIVVLLAMGRSPMRAAFWGVVAAAIATLFAATTRLDLERARVTVAAAASLQPSFSRQSVPLSWGWDCPRQPPTSYWRPSEHLHSRSSVSQCWPRISSFSTSVAYPTSLRPWRSPPMRLPESQDHRRCARLLVPFMFVYGPPLLLEAAAPIVLIATVTGIVGVTALSAAIIGFARHRLSTWQRLLLAIAAGVLIFPGVVSDLLGIAAIAVVFSGRAAHRHQTGAL
jgi:TRAP-type uncharacterized transport system fused permease subunit